MNCRRAPATTADVALAEGAAGAMRLADRVARARGKKLDAGGQHQFLARGVDGADIGGIHPDEPADAVAPPERDREQVGERAKRRHLADDEARLLLQLGEGAALAGQLAQAQDGAAAAGAPARLEQRAARGAERDLEALAVAAELVGRGFKLGRAFRREPVAEGEEGALLDRDADALRQAAEHLRLGSRTLPDDRPLVVGVEKRAGPVERRIQRRDLLFRRRQALVAPRVEIKAEGDERGERRSRRHRPPDEVAERAGAKRRDRRATARAPAKARADAAISRSRAALRPSKSTGSKFPRLSSPSAPPHPGGRARTNQSNLTAPPEAEKARIRLAAEMERKR